MKLSETLVMPRHALSGRHGRKGSYQVRLGRPVNGAVPALVLLLCRSGCIEGCSIHFKIPDDMIRQFPAYKDFPFVRLLHLPCALVQTATQRAAGQLPSISIVSGRSEPYAFFFENVKQCSNHSSASASAFLPNGLHRNKHHRDYHVVEKGVMVFGDRRFSKSRTSVASGFEVFSCLRDCAPFFLRNFQGQLSGRCGIGLPQNWDASPRNCPYL